MKRVMIIRHVANEALGTLETVLLARGLELEVVDCFAATWPDIERAGFPVDRLAGLVVMGGTMNANETSLHPFLATEVQWLRQALAAQLPTLGICLGAQLLAKALGARVYRNRVPEIGFHPLELLPAAQDDPLFSASAVRQTVFHWHSDTFDLPQSAIQLARSESCQQQAFRYGPNAYGLQFHVEMTAHMVDDWLDEPTMCAELTALAADPQVIRRQAPLELGHMAPLTKQVLGRFATMCIDRAR